MTSRKQIFQRAIFSLSSHSYKVCIAPVSSKEPLDTQATMECGFILKRARDMIRCTVQIITHNTAQPFGQFG